jgi:hypothetical protein
MRLVKQNKSGWQYLLKPHEARFLRMLVNQMPAASIAPIRISETDAGPQAVERQALLQEALTEHRAELKRQAGNLVSAGRFKSAGNDELFRLNAEERETLLQILNDIRIESWRVLGEPEALEMDPSMLPKEQHRPYQLMHLAGYFEYHLLNLEPTTP